MMTFLNVKKCSKLNSKAVQLTFELLVMKAPVIAMLLVVHLGQLLPTHGKPGNTSKGLPYLRKLRS